MLDEGFLGGSVAKNLPVKAGDAGSIPDPGRFHMPRETKPCTNKFWAWAAATEGWVPRAWALRQETTAMRAPAPQLKISPCYPQLEERPHSHGDPTQTKINKQNLGKKKKKTATVFYNISVNIVF